MFLLKSDFELIIPESELNQIIGYDEEILDTNLTKAIDTAIEDVKGYLRARYDVSQIFADVLEYDYEGTQEEGNRYISSDKVHYLCIKEAPAEIELTNTEYFVQRDSRNQKIIEVCCDIALYNVMSRLNNYDIPNFRKERYDGNTDRQTGGAIGWLLKVAKGTIEPDLPLLEASQENQTGNIVMSGYAEDSAVNNQSF